jgi:hypothetical protein
MEANLVSLFRAKVPFFFFALKENVGPRIKLNLASQVIVSNFVWRLFWEYVRITNRDMDACGE